MKDETKGFISAIIAYGLWGIFPIYWKFIHHVNSFEIVFHRIVWSFIFLVLILAIKKELKNSFAHIKDFSILKYFFMSSLMIGSNWFLYIWSVNNDNILETSLGYYMAPIFNVIFAKIFLKETLTKGRFIAFLFVITAIMNMILGLNHFPWVSITLAVTFSLYGLLRKKGKIGSLEGLFIETFLLGIPSLIIIIILYFNGSGSFLKLDFKTDILLILAGPTTAIPLLTFAYAARRLQFITLGIIQYLAPTVAFLIGVFLYKENFTPKHLLTFTLIWLAISIYIIDSYHLITRK